MQDRHVYQFQRQEIETGFFTRLTQLGECYPYKLEVIGSNPIPSIYYKLIFKKNYNIIYL